MKVPAGQQVALSLVALIGVPVLVGQIAPTSAEPPAPQKASLTVQLEDTEQTTTDSGRILIWARGLPPKEASSLNSADGLTTTKATASTRGAVGFSDCRGLPSHHASATPGGTPWCVSLAGIQGGHSVSGVLAGPRTELTLTVNRRVDFFGTPLLLILAGLLVGGLVIVIPKVLRLLTRKALLETILEENDASSDPIEDLRAWIASQRNQGKSDDQLLPAATALVRRAPALAEKARAELRQWLAMSTLPHDHPARAAAERELARASRRADFIDNDEKPVEHPARLLAAALAKLEAQATVLSQLGSEVGALPADQRAQATEALNIAQGRFAIADNPDDVEKLDELIENTRQAVAEAKQTPPPPIPFFSVAGGMVFSPKEAIGGLIVGPPMPALGTRLGTLAWRFAVPIVATLLVLLLVAAWAVLTIKLTVYDPKPAFGSGEYLTLLVAAVGSGAAGSILTIASAWNPLSPPAEE